MKKVSFCLFLFAFIQFSAKAQSDSLSIASKNQIAIHLYLSNPDSSIAIVNKSLIVAKSKNLPYLEGESYFILSKANWVKANYRLSAEYGFKALRIFENSPYILYWGQTLLTIARNFGDLDELRESNSMIHSALHLATQYDNEKLLADAYREHSLLLIRLKLYDSAMLMTDKGIAFYEKSKSTSDLGILYSRKAELYLLKQDFEKSLFYNIKSLQYDLQSNNKRALSIGYFHFAENYFRQHKLDSAKKMLELSSALAHSIGNLPIRIRCHTLMASIFESEHHTLNAMNQLKIISTLKDSLQLRENSRQLTETLAINELENKEANILVLETENRMEKQLVKTQRLVSYFLIAAILLLVLLVFSLWRLRKNQTLTNQLLTEKNVAIEQQRKEIQDQAENLQELNQLKIKLFSVISHDLRGPIANIQALLRMVTEKIITHEEFVLLSEKLKMDLNINQRTLENLLNWSLSQMDGMKRNQKIFKVSEVINDVIPLMSEMASQKQINIINNSENDCEIVADYNHIHLILRNIIHNAIKFSPTQKSISISTSSVNTYCKITIQDSGVGLSKAEIETLLNSDDYHSKEGTQFEKGTGLGLLLCKDFIKRNGGTFQIISTPNEGTEVSFTIPLA